MRAGAFRQVRHNAHSLMSDTDATEPSNEASHPSATKGADSSAHEPRPTPVKSGGLDLSDLKFMPDWVADFNRGSSVPSRSYEDERPRERRDGGRGGERGGFGAPRTGGDRDRRGAPGGKGFDRGGRDQRTEGRSGDRRNSRSGGGRFEDRRDRGPDRAWVSPPQDITLTVYPDDKSLDALATHIRSTGHAFSLFDVARLVLAGNDRFGLRFVCDAKRSEALYHVPADGALFLTREEALQHILHGSALESFYKVIEIEVEEPKGNFPSIAVCGFTGDLIAPPSHHSFQTTVIRRHRERFSNMSLDDYKRRIRTEANPDLVQRWKDEQRKALRWVPLSDLPSEDSELPPAESSPPAEEPIRVDAALAEEVDLATSAETSPEENSGETVAESVEESPEVESPRPAPSIEPATAIKSRVEVEAHFRRHYLETAIVEVRDLLVPGNIDKRLLSPALFSLVRQSVEGARKHLFEMSQKLSAGFERRGLKTFKRRSGKMFTSRVRPRAIDPKTVFSERVTAMVNLLKKAPGGLQAKDLVSAVLPPEALPVAPSQDGSTALTDDQVVVLKDLRWLVNEGYLIEYSDGLVCLGVQGESVPKPKIVAQKSKSTPDQESVPTQDVEPNPEPGSTEAEAVDKAEAVAEVDSAADPEGASAPKEDSVPESADEPEVVTHEESEALAEEEPEATATEVAKTDL